MTDSQKRGDQSTPDIAANNREALEAAFPGVIADGVLDATHLGELLDVPVTASAEGRERFGLMWICWSFRRWLFAAIHPKIYCTRSIS